MTKASAKKLLRTALPFVVEFLKGAVRAIGQYVTKQLLNLL
jgi:hypothetical protein